MISNCFQVHMLNTNSSLNSAFTYVRVNLLYDANSVKRLISVNPWWTRINEGREENFTPPEPPTLPTPPELPTPWIARKRKQGETMRELFDRDQHVQNTLWRKA